MENPLENIKNIQASLQLMKARLQSLSKTELKNIQNIEKTFGDSMSIIRHKLQDCKKAERNSEARAMKDVMNTSKMQTLKQQKFIQEKELTRSREILTAMKFTESQQIKKASKQNQRIIEQIKQNYLKEKQRRSTQIKENRQKSKEKISQFHAIKKQQLQRQRQKEVYANKVKAMKLAQKISAMSSQQQKVVNRFKESCEVLQKLRFAVRKMEKMHTDDFSQLKEKVGLVGEDQLNEEIAEKLLNQVVAVSVQGKAKSSYE